MDRRLQYLVRASGDRDRKLMILGVILAILCLALYINLTIMLSKRSSDRNRAQIKNKSSQTTTDITSMATANSVQFNLSMIIVDQPMNYQNYTLSDPIQYETSSGHPLGNYLYLNVDQYCYFNGYVSSVYLRLFTNWKGNASLYLFTITVNVYGLGITHRYAIQSPRDTTDWQTISIPSHALPISLGSFLAIGMQDSSTMNQIYTVKAPTWLTGMGMIVKNINATTTVFTPEGIYTFGFAFGYTMAYNAETTTTTKAISVG